MSDVLKTCSCGARFTAATWKALPLVGSLDQGTADEAVMRNCSSCRSTMAVLVSDLLPITTETAAA